MITTTTVNPSACVMTTTIREREREREEGQREWYKREENICTVSEKQGNELKKSKRTLKRDVMHLATSRHTISEINIRWVNNV